MITYKHYICTKYYRGVKNMSQRESYNDHINGIHESLELGKEYEMLVTNSSMTPLFNPYDTKIRISAINAKYKLNYGAIVLYSRVSQSVSIRRIVRVGNHTIDVRGILQRHVESKLPKSGVIGVVSAYTVNGHWVKTNSIVHIVLCSTLVFYSFFYRIYRNLLKQIQY